MWFASPRERVAGRFCASAQRGWRGRRYQVCGKNGESVVPPNVPWDGRDAHGKSPPRTARERAHTLPMRSPRSARWPSTRPTSLRCRLPLLITYACRARAQRKLQPTKSLQSNDWAGCDSVDRQLRRKLARAHCCSFSAAAFCSHHLGRANGTMDSSTTIDSRRKTLL